MTSKEPFPIKTDHISTLSSSQLTPGERIYGKSAYCNEYEFEDAIKRMQYVWDPALMRRLGPNKNVNGHRIILLYHYKKWSWSSLKDQHCVYPAEPMAASNSELNKLSKELKLKVQESPTGVHIERNQKGFFYIADDETYYTNYWMQLLDSDGTILGVIGMQVKMEDYNQLIPEAVIEEPYTLSLIMLYNKNLERMWQMECRGSDCDKQDINQAADFIDQAIKQ